MDTIQLEEQGHEVEISELKAHTLLKKYTETLEKELNGEADENIKKAEDLRNIGENNELLTQEEEAELLAKYTEANGKVKAKSQLTNKLWSTLNKFMKGEIRE